MHTHTNTNTHTHPQEALDKLTIAAEQVLELEATRLKLLDYIESRMNVITKKKSQMSTRYYIC